MLCVNGEFRSTWIPPQEVPEGLADDQRLTEVYSEVPDGSGAQTPGWSPGHVDQVAQSGKRKNPFAAASAFAILLESLKVPPTGTGSDRTRQMEAKDSGPGLELAEPQPHGAVPGSSQRVWGWHCSGLPRGDPASTLWDLRVTFGPSHGRLSELRAAF